MMRLLKQRVRDTQTSVQFLLWLEMEDTSLLESLEKEKASTSLQELQAIVAQVAGRDWFLISLVFMNKKLVMDLWQESISLP